MQASEFKQRVLGTLDLLRAGRRDEAAGVLADVVRQGPGSGELWKDVALLAGRIGEIDLAIESSRRFASTSPVKLSRMLQYWRELTTYGRPEIVEQDIPRQGPAVTDHPTVLHVRGQLAAQRGEFDAARELYLRAMADPDMAAQCWFSLSMITDMSEAPEWVDRMVALDKAPATGGDQVGRTRLLYGLGKAFHDCGDYARAMEYYRRGAESRQHEAKYNPAQLEQFAQGLIRDFTPEAVAALKPAGDRPRSSIFVNGLPRSGTTLVEQILVAHSEVAEGAEVNLARAALIPTVDYSYSGALHYQSQRTDLGDPWGAIAHQYQRMLAMRFRTTSLVVDKSLTQSHIMGLILHALPECPMIWVRRNRLDIALSCFRTYITSPLPWSWRFEDMGHFFAVEDALFAHWTKLFGDRILVVDYQQLVSDPEPAMRRIADHAGLKWEDGMLNFHEKQRVVRTASLQQVRQPISAARVGQSDTYAKWMDGFRSSYDEAAARMAAAQASRA